MEKQEPVPPAGIASINNNKNLWKLALAPKLYSFYFEIVYVFKHPFKNKHLKKISKNSTEKFHKFFSSNNF